MAVLTLTGHRAAGNIKAAVQTVCYVRQAWEDEWRLVPWLWCFAIHERIPPLYTYAELRYEFGEIANPGKPFRVVSPLVLDNQFVRVDVLSGGGRATVFVGVIAAHSDDLFDTTSAGVPGGRQFLAAFGVESLLDRNRIGSAFVNEDGAPREVKRSLAFNHRRGNGLKVFGNRSKDPDENGIYMFDDDPETGRAAWTHRQIIEYLFAHFNTQKPWFFLTGQASALEQFVDVFDPGGLSVWGCLTKLIDRRRGLVWRSQLSRDVEFGRIDIRTTVERDVTVAGVVIPANAEQTELAHEGFYDVSPTVRVSNVHVYDLIQVRGAYCKCMLTLGVAEGSLEPAWSEDDEEAYKAATDEERTRDKYARVYTTFRVPKDWNWTVRTIRGVEVPVAPLVDDLAFVDHRESNPGYTHGHRFERNIPLVEPDSAESADPEYREPFAVIRDAETDPWFYTDRGDVLEKGVYQMRVLDDELGIRMQGRTNHGLARDAFGASETETPAELDYGQLKATVFLETDSPLEASVRIPANSVTGTAKQMLVEMPEAEYWYELESTIEDVEDGVLVESDSEDVTVLRDDGWRVRGMLSRVVAYYGRIKTECTIEIAGVALFLRPGEMITRVRTAAYPYQRVGTIVTEKTIQFVTEDGLPRTVISTGFQELEFESFASRARHGRRRTRGPRKRR